MSEEGLRKAAIPEHGAPTDEKELQRLVARYRWSPGDSPHHLAGEEYFDEVQNVVTEVAEVLDAIDIDDDDWTEFEDFHSQIADCLCHALSAVDAEGVFGTGPPRECVTLTVMMGDQDDTIVEYADRLNPPATAARFRDAWRRWGELWALPEE